MMRHVQTASTSNINHNAVMAIDEHSETQTLLPKLNATTSVNSSTSTAPSTTALPGGADTTNANASFVRRRFINPLMDVLKSGSSAEGIALSLSFGLTCGVFPVPTTTTLTCILCSYLFRLNFPAVQITNLLMTPINLATFVPFIRCGEAMFGVEQSELKLSMFQDDPLNAIRVFWLSLLRGIVAWLVFLPIATAVCYVVLKPIIQQLMTNMKFT